MISNKLNFEKPLENLIHVEGLDNMEIYKKEYCDFEEFPLFSRFKNINFLSDISFDEKNKILIKAAINLLKKINEHIYLTKINNKSINRFICLTITDWNDFHEINCLTPSIFVSSKREWIIKKLKLIKSNSTEENLIQDYLSDLGIVKFNVLSPKENKSEDKRIYVVPESVLPLT